MIGILIIDHGSRRREANATLADLAARVQRLAGATACAYAHMELAEPTVAQGFAELVAHGVTDIRVVPYFLAPGRHASEDIPSLVAEAAAGFAQVTWRISPCLGPDDVLAQLVVTRAEVAERTRVTE